MKFSKHISALLVTTSLMACSFAFAAHGTRTYEVTVTNLTSGSNFTPLIATTHNRQTSIFKLGEPASDALADLAEGGDTGPLETLFSESSHYLNSVTTAGLLGPGESVTLIIESDHNHRLLSLAGMVLPTNDAFVAINSIRLPGNMLDVFAKAYDAGTEENDELCANIPGPTCGGTPFSDGQAEGYVYVSSGIHGSADLDAIVHDWNNPIAKVSIHLMSTQ